MKPHRLLIADDEEDFRFVLKDHFEHRGYEVAEGVDGLDALEIFREAPEDFDLVITDIRMPRMGGEELIRELRKIRPFLPIIGVTGHADLSGKINMLDEGAYYYLDKPLPRWPIVERLIENAIRLHRHEEEIRASRAKENEIARLLRAYLMKDPPAPVGPAKDHRIALDIALEPVENDLPGGDFVEWFFANPDEVVFYIADASGHDDIRSCFMSCLASLVLHRSHHVSEPPVDQVIRDIDSALAELRGAHALGYERFLTFFLGRIDLRSGELQYVSAGHPEAFLWRGPEREQLERLRSTSRPVGFLFDTQPGVGRVVLRPGDLLFLYTDGASEMLEDGGGAQIGVDRLAQKAQPARDESVRTIVDRVTVSLREDAGEDGFPDDTTLFALSVAAV